MENLSKFLLKGLITCMILCCALPTYAQKRITLKLQNTSLSAAMESIAKQSGYTFFFNDNVNSNTRVTVNVVSTNIDEVMRGLLKDSGISYKLVNRRIVLFNNESTTSPKSKVSPTTTVTLSGMVISSSDNRPLVGVLVYVPGTSIGATTSAQGEYTIKVPSNVENVTFSYLGYETKQLRVADSFLFKLVTMIEQVNKMEDVVVVGFGVQKKESLVGAVQAVKPSDLTITSSNLTTAFAGNIAGIISSQSSGEPGYDNATFYIRGVSTFGANKNPMIVLDGVEIVSAMLNNIPPETIESFSMLKDATATALYGSRGANGVIIITTKSGRDSERMKINVRFENTFSMPTKVQDIANGVTYMEAYNEAIRNSTPAGEEYTPYYSEAKITGTRDHLNPYIFPDNNWYSMLFKDMTVNQNFNFNMTGGSKKIDYFLNASIFNENGIVKSPSDSKYDTGINNQKYLFQSNVSAMVTRTTRVALKINTQLWYNNRPKEDVGDLFYYTMRANPVRFPATLPSQAGDTFVRYGNNLSWDSGKNDLNPYALLSSGYGNRYYSYLTSAFTVDQDLSCITKGLSAKALVSFYNYTYSSSYRSFTPFYYKVSEEYTQNEDGSYNFDMESIGDPGSTYLTSSVGRGGHREYSFQGSLDYTRQFGKHDLGAMMVYHMKEKILNTPSTDENDILPYRERGLAGRITYNFDKRYLVEFNFGYNGSENFISGKRFGFFPSVAVGYSISNERFFEPLKKVITSLKFRASYGESGNDALSERFPYLSTVSMGNNLDYYPGINFSGTTGPNIDRIGNAASTWEIAKKLNIGMDLTLFEALDLSIDYFKEDRSGIFMKRQSVPSSVGLGAATPWANLGAVRNHGVDLSVNYNKAFSSDLILNIRGTFTYAHNEVTAMDEPELLYPYTSKLGHPINTVFGLVADGLFTSQEDIDSNPKQEFEGYSVGDIKYRDLNGDNKIDANDITALGSPTVPEIVYGFGASLRYRKWDFSFFFQGSGNVSLLMSDMHPFGDKSHYGYNITQYIAADHWSETNQDPNAAYPRLTSQWSVNNTQTSSYYMRNASYIRLKNAEIGFTIKGLRIYIAGSNLFTISNFKNWDPEMGSGNGLKYPLQRTAKIGLQYQF